MRIAICDDEEKQPAIVNVNTAKSPITINSSVIGDFFVYFKKIVDFTLSGKCIFMLQGGDIIENKRGLRENRTK